MGYGSQILFKDLNLKITPKTRLGLMGNNGVGKSTLIRVATGIEEPLKGTVFRSDQLQISYFEQKREALDPTLTVMRTVCPFGETVEFQGNKIHVRSYLDRFLFSGSVTDMIVSKLSGGEQARLLLAMLMLRPANLLILDEPTNDLDLQTLAVLEDCLREFPGAVILVTHDRSFMDEVCNQILAFPEMTPFAAIDQWEQWFKKKMQKSDGARGASEGRVVGAGGNDRGAGAGAGATKKKKLSYKEQIEYDQMEKTLAMKETALAELEEKMQDPAVLSHASELTKITVKIGDLHGEIEKLYARWAELEQKG